MSGMSASSRTAKRRASGPGTSPRSTRHCQLVVSAMKRRYTPACSSERPTDGPDEPSAARFGVEIRLLMMHLRGCPREKRPGGRRSAETAPCRVIGPIRRGSACHGGAPRGVRPEARPSGRGGLCCPWVRRLREGGGVLLEQQRAHRGEQRTEHEAVVSACAEDHARAKVHYDPTVDDPMLRAPQLPEHGAASRAGADEATHTGRIAPSPGENEVRADRVTAAGDRGRSTSLRRGILLTRSPASVARFVFRRPMVTRAPWTTFVSAPPAMTRSTCRDRRSRAVLSYACSLTVSTRCPSDQASSSACT